MGKAIGAAIVGYIAMAVLVFVGLSLVWMSLGADGAFAEDAWDTSMAWSLWNVVVGVVAAIAGGYVCALISPGGLSMKILIGIVVVLGALSVVATLAMKPDVVDPRPETVTMFEAMGSAQAPLWTVLANPVIGVIGILVAFRLRGQPAASAASE